MTPLCGTNIATAGILASLATLAVAGTDARRRLANGMLAGIVAVTVAQPSGRLIQEKLTTSPDLADTEMVAIETARTADASCTHKPRAGIARRRGLTSHHASL